MVDANCLTDLAKSGYTEPTGPRHVLGIERKDEFVEALVQCAGHAHDQERKSLCEVLAFYSASDAEQFPIIILPGADIELPGLFCDGIDVGASVLTAVSKFR